MTQTRRVDSSRLNEELNPSVSDATVYKPIQKLIDAGIIKEVALDDDQRRQGYPWEFYGLTEEGRAFLEEHNLLVAEETLQQLYDTISDKSERRVKYENTPRPDDI
jgi:DNA-binding MarR family transcriptional regulator